VAIGMGKSKTGGDKLVVRMSFHNKSYMTSSGSKSRLCFENPELWEGSAQQLTRAIGSSGQRGCRERKQDRQNAYNSTMRRVRATIIATETQ